MEKWFERKPLVALAPMEAITDMAYRTVVRSITKDVVLYTEFAPARGLLHEAAKVWQMADFDDSQRPLVVQLYDNDAVALGEAAAEVVKRKRPDGIDLNMGCPVKKVARRGAGCGMMATPENSADSVRRIVENADGVPVSIKTRLGIRSKTEVIDFAQAMVEAGAQQVTIHGRLKADRPRVPADWQAISEAAQTLNVPVIGNGDIWKDEDAEEMMKLKGLSGVMIARGAIGNPWLLKRSYQRLAGLEIDPLPTREERGQVAIQHLQANVATKGERRGVLELRKVVRNYIKGYMDSKKTWMKIIETETEAETAKILETFSKGDDGLYVGGI